MDTFNLKTKIISGAGSVSALAQLGIRRLMLVCDPYFTKNGAAERILLAAKAEASEIFSQVVPDPSAVLAAEGAAAVKRFAPDTVVALGGGSAMDCAKAMVYFSGLQPMLVAIPTTSGSGSEVTNFSILTHDGVKHPLVDDAIQPNVAILDSQLVETLPPTLVADGGFDLISHALEALVATNANAFSDTLATEAFCTAMQDLSASFGADTAARSRIHTAATMAGIAFSQSGLGLCHAISHSLGGEFHISHGRLNAILLPAVLDCNATACGIRYAQLAQKAGLSSGNEVMALRALKNALLKLRRSLNMPDTLAQAGISPTLVREKLDALVSASLADPCCATNPVKPDSAMVRQIIREVMGRG